MLKNKHGKPKRAISLERTILQKFVAFAVSCAFEARRCACLPGKVLQTGNHLRLICNGADESNRGRFLVMVRIGVAVTCQSLG